MSGATVSPDVLLEIFALQTEYGLALDEDRLEVWPDFFAEKCYYKVTSQENVSQKLPAGMLLCDSRPALKDRVLYMRRAAIANIHRDRHMINLPVVRKVEGDRYTVTTNFAVLQAEPDRESRIFGFGYYDDVIVRVDGRLKFESKIVVLESRSVTPLLGSPI